jgi:hypothetical protein
MITKVEMLSEGVFKLNGAIIVSNFDFADEGVSYSIDYNEDIVTEYEANEIAETFIREALENAITKKSKGN